MRRSSLASDEGDFGHWRKARTFFSTSVVSWASSSVGVPDQSFQDGIGSDGPDCGGHPDDQEAEIGLAEVDVGAEQLDRALAAGRGQGQVPRGAPKVDAGVFDNRPALGADLDGMAAGITEVEVTVRGVAVAIAVVADANEDRRRAALEPRGGLECARTRRMAQSDGTSRQARM